jgi:hypothetical protein
LKPSKRSTSQRGEADGEYLPPKGHKASQ